MTNRRSLPAKLRNLRTLAASFHLAISAINSLRQSILELFRLLGTVTVTKALNRRRTGRSFTIERYEKRCGFEKGYFGRAECREPHCSNNLMLPSASPSDCWGAREGRMSYRSNNTTQQKRKERYSYDYWHNEKRRRIEERRVSRAQV